MSFFLWPAIATLFLVFLHCLFGSFVLKRGILFIDLALAQWAAFGYLLAHLFCLHHPLMQFLMAFLMTVLAAALLSILRCFYQKANEIEALIGALYLAASTLSLTVMASSGLEGQHLSELLGGSLLFVQKNDVLITALIYLVIGLTLWRFYQIFEQGKKGIWDFFFYALFGLAVTSSVKIAGVMLVFAYLILPILSAQSLLKTTKSKLIFAWSLGLIASLIGMGLSFIIDIAPAYLIILSLLASWLLTLLFTQNNIIRKNFFI